MTMTMTRGWGRESFPLGSGGSDWRGVNFHGLNHVLQFGWLNMLACRRPFRVKKLNGLSIISLRTIADQSGNRRCLYQLPGSLEPVG